MNNARETISKEFLPDDSSKLNHTVELFPNFFNFFLKNKQKLGKSILNIGLDAHPDGHSGIWIDWFLKIGFEQICALEYHNPNVVFFENLYRDNPKFSIIHGDVRLASMFIDKKFDISFWWHGPEHIPKSDLKQAFSELERLTNNAIISVCPWGNYYCINNGRYPGDEHHYYPENEDFLDVGLNVFNEGGPKNTGNANIIAYKLLK